MTKRLTILLTESLHDRGLMLQGKIKDYETIYVDCDGANKSGPHPIDSARLLCVVMWKRSTPPNRENTARIVSILDNHRYEHYETVVGTHNMGDLMEDALDVRVIGERHPGVPITEYSTVHYTFVKTWSKELSKVGTDAVDVEYVRYGFDRLFDLLKKGLLLTPSRRISLIKHRLSNLFLPVDNDLHGLHETGFAPEYWKDVVEAYRGGRAVGILQEAEHFIYAADEVRDTVEKVCHEASHDFPEAKGEVEKCWQKVRDLLPASRVPSNGAVKETPEDLGNADHSAEGVPSKAVVKGILEDLENADHLTSLRGKCGKYNNDFHVWFVSLLEALEELRRAMPEKEESSVRPGKEAARG